jgi:two-component system, OmpR family, sensor histidine kinase KdpD
VVGKTLRTGPSRLLRGPLSDRLSALAQDLDVYVVGHEAEVPPLGKRVFAPFTLEGEAARGAPWREHAWAVGVCALATVLATALAPHITLTNVIMLYLAGVVAVAARLGRGAAVLVSFLSVVAFDFFFVPPRFSFTVADTQYLPTFAIMLAVALTISHLTAGMRYQASVALYRERRTRALNELGRELAGALMAEQIVEAARRHLEGVFQARVCVLLPDAQEKIHPPQPQPTHRELPLDLAIAQWVYDHQQPAGMGTQSLPGAPMHYLPLKAPMRTRGVLALLATDRRLIFQPEQARLLETFAAQIALALERVHYVEVAQDALVRMESERLRNSLLSAISHDTRTPLTAIVGLSGTLARNGQLGEARRRELAEAIHEEARRMSGLVDNLLDMARLQAGGVRLNRQWQSLEELVGSALTARQWLLEEHEVRVALPPELPLILVDGVLIERVLCNLVENAAKYTPPGSRIEIGATVADGELRVQVSDNGPGLPRDKLETVFDKFTRGAKESAQPGVGLGLSICRAIVQAHDGRIWAENRPEGGARFSFALPLLEPPARPPELEELA